MFSIFSLKGSLWLVPSVQSGVIPLQGSLYTVRLFNLYFILYTLYTAGRHTKETFMKKMVAKCQKPNSGNAGANIKDLRENEVSESKRF